ncbi:MAG: ribonuclease HI family protein, partial [Deltaproteobacteria bacterium]|nr:ribonuclease HI family protein [Deltaproteobacteria bacterium]
MTIRLELLNKLKSLAAWPPTPKISPGRYLLRADGAAKNNPGHAGAGIVIFDPQDQVFLAKGWYLGRLTNNAAEWEALVLGLTIAKAQGLTHLEVALDSELVVKQFLGVYRVRSEGLIPYWREARNLALGFSNFRIGHVYREKNKDADRLASQAALKGAKGELAVLADLELDPDLAIKFGPQSDSQSAAKAPEKTPPEKNIDQPLEKSLDKQLEKQPKKQPEKPREKPLDKLLGQPKIEPLAQGPFAAKSLSQDNQNQDSQSPNSQKQENQNQDNQKAMVSPKSQNKNNISQSRETFSLFDNLVPETTKP